MTNTIKSIVVTGAVLLAAMFAGTGCKSSQKALSLPFEGKQYQTDNNHFRARSSGSSPDLETAKRIALQLARTEMATNIQATMKAVSEIYTNQMQVGNVQEFGQTFDAISRQVVDQTLNDVKIIGERAFQEADGRYRYWVVIEMSKEPLVRGLEERISNDDRMKLEFDRHRFRQIFEDEMKKFKENQ